MATFPAIIHAGPLAAHQMLQADLSDCPVHPMAVWVPFGTGGPRATLRRLCPCLSITPNLSVGNAGGQTVSYKHGRAKLQYVAGEHYGLFVHNIKTGRKALTQLTNLNTANVDAPSTTTKVGSDAAKLQCISQKLKQCHQWLVALNMPSSDVAQAAIDLASTAVMALLADANTSASANVTDIPATAIVNLPVVDTDIDASDIYQSDAATVNVPGTAATNALGAMPTEIAVSNDIATNPKVNKVTMATARLSTTGQHCQHQVQAVDNTQIMPVGQSKRQPLVSTRQSKRRPLVPIRQSKRRCL